MRALSTRQPADAQARRRVLDPERSFIVQAPAGSGKTELLTRRLLVLLARVERPEEILAITFTRKAAAEMRDRILQALEGAAATEGRECPAEGEEGEALPLARAALARSRALGWDLTRNPSRLRVQTIDSLLASLVGQMPWLSRLGEAPAIADRPEDLYEEAAGLVLEELDAEGAFADSLASVLEHLDNQAADLRSLLVDLLARRDQWTRHRSRIDPTTLRPELEEGLAAAVRGCLDGARGALEPWRAEISALARYAGENAPSDSFIVRLAGLASLPGAEPSEKPLWEGLAELFLTQKGEWRSPKGITKNQGFPAGKGEEAGWKRRLVSLLEALEGEEGARHALSRVRRVPGPVYSEGQWAVVSAVIRVVDLALGRLWEVMGREKRADFAEVALKALQALGDAEGPSELLLALDRRIAHILVDEFQDTSFLQLELLARLTEGWTRGDGRTLFLVGDPMQSIYRFREAEVGLFLRVWKEGLDAVALEPVRIEANFRSQTGLVEWVNGAFPTVFPAEADAGSGAVPYSRSAAVKPSLPGEAVVLRPFLGVDDSGEGREVAEAVFEARKLGTVGILVRSRTHLASILPALQDRGIRYRAQDLDPLAERPVVRDIVSLTRALLHPGDRLSWLAVLRAPWCGLTLSDLHTLACGSERPLPELLRDPLRLEALSAEGRPRVATTWATLGAALAGARRRTLRAWVEGTWLALGAPAYLSAQEREDAEAVFDLLERLDRGGEIRPLEDLEKRLGSLFARPDPEADEAVEVMTIHKAKGLQFDTTLLPGLGKAPRGDRRRLLYWLETPEGRLLLAPLPRREEKVGDPIADYIRSLEAEKDRHERARLLYVAFTRARQRVLAWAHVDPRSDGAARPRKGSLLEALWPAVAGRFEGLAAPPAPDAQGTAPPRPTFLARLPEGWAAPALAPPLLVAERPTLPKRAEAQELSPAFLWAGEASRHVGTVAHRLLERVAQEGLAAWGGRRLEGLAPSIRSQLLGLGVSRPEADAALAQVAEVVSAALEDPRGRWILQARDEAASELALAGVWDGGVVHRSVDRTFVDEEGVRWIIDFKTSTHEGGGLSEFLDAEQTRYRPQLAAYAALLRALEPSRPVKAALYYPLLRGWREVEV